MGLESGLTPPPIAWYTYEKAAVSSVKTPARGCDTFFTPFMAKNLLDTEIGKGTNALSLERFVRLLLLHGQVTRMQIGEQSGFSPASVTQKSKWLSRHNFISKVAERKEHSKRPVETLFLAVQPWVALAVRVCAQEVSAVVTDSTSAVLASFSQAIERPCQRTVFTALGEMVVRGQEWAQQAGRELAGVTLAVDGVVSDSVAGMVHSLNGVGDWMPCAPKFMHPQLFGLPLIVHWTQIVCKLHGLARQLGTDDHVAYVEVHERDLHLALMQDGVIRLGRMGTSGHFLHQSVQKSGGHCYCGRTGCLDALLRAGKATDAMLFAAIDAQVGKFGIRHLGLESLRPQRRGGRPYANAALQTLVLAEDGGRMVREGVALLAAEAVLLRQMHDLQN